MDIFDRIVKEYGLPLYNPNVAIYAVNVNEALNAPSVSLYTYKQSIFWKFKEQVKIV